MILALLKRLMVASNEGEMSASEFSKTSTQPMCFEYALFSEDCLIKGGVVLRQETNIYSNFFLTTFGLVPATSPEGVFWQEASGEIVIHFNINFAEGEAVDFLQGTLTLLDGLSKNEQGQWVASVHSSACEVAKAKGTWSRRKL